MTPKSCPGRRGRCSARCRGTRRNPIPGFARSGGGVPAWSWAKHDSTIGDLREYAKQLSAALGKDFGKLIMAEDSLQHFEQFHSGSEIIVMGQDFLAFLADVGALAAAIEQDIENPNQMQRIKAGSKKHD